jgi:hypothetical protein
MCGVAERAAGLPGGISVPTGPELRNPYTPRSAIGDERTCLAPQTGYHALTLLHALPLLCALAGSSRLNLRQPKSQHATTAHASRRSYARSQLLWTGSSQLHSERPIQNGTRTAEDSRLRREWARSSLGLCEYRACFSAHACRRRVTSMCWHRSAPSLDDIDTDGGGGRHAHLLEDQDAHVSWDCKPVGLPGASSRRVRLQAHLDAGLS